MGTEQQGEQVTNEQTELDGYFGAWASTLTDVVRECDSSNEAAKHIKEALLDAWHHRAGEGAPPECVAFIAEHSPIRRLLDAKPYLSNKDPVGDLITRFDTQGDLLLEVGRNRHNIVKERNALRLELAQVREEQRQERETANRMRNEAFALQRKVDELIDNSYAMHEELQLLRANDRTMQVRELFNVVLPDQERLDKPGIPSEETVRFRLRLITEEFFELFRSVYAISGQPRSSEYDGEFRDVCKYIENAINNAHIRVDLFEFIDALGDLDVVIEGARIAFGVDGRPIARAIHAANMAKKDGPKRESDGKRLKPPGWKPADVAALLREQGWQG